MKSYSGMLYVIDCIIIMILLGLLIYLKKDDYGTNDNLIFAIEIVLWVLIAIMMIL